MSFAFLAPKVDYTEQLPTACGPSDRNVARMLVRKAGRRPCRSLTAPITGTTNMLMIPDKSEIHHDASEPTRQQFISTLSWCPRKSPPRCEGCLPHAGLKTSCIPRAFGEGVGHRTTSLKGLCSEGLCSEVRC